MGALIFGGTEPETVAHRLGDIAAAAGDAEAGMNIFNGTLKHIVYQGDSVLTQVTLPDGQVICMRGASQPDPTEIQVGGPVTLGLRREDTILVCDD